MTKKAIIVSGLLIGCQTNSKESNETETTTIEDTGTGDSSIIDAECGLVWPIDPFHAAVYSFVAEYILVFGPAVGCFLDYYPDQTFGTVAEELETTLRTAEPMLALEDAQQWVNDNAAIYDQPVFNLIAVFDLVVHDNTVTGGLGFAEEPPSENQDCSNQPWEDNPSENNYFEITDNPNPDLPGLKCFNRHVDVLGLSIYAEDALTNQQVLHAAAVLAELLDNDEDGVVDDQDLYAQLLSSEAMIPMFNSESSAAAEDFFYNYQGTGVSAVLFANEVDPTQPGHWGADATVEEIMHTINHRGHVAVYPEAFGIAPNSSLLTTAMDIARGGQFLSVPSTYPEEAWYHYDDETCDYECMAIEYIYWAQVSNMGLLDDPQTCAGIDNEWELCSVELLQSTDALVYDLITDPQYFLPQLAPDGTYSPIAD